MTARSCDTMTTPLAAYFKFLFLGRPLALLEARYSESRPLLLEIVVVALATGSTTTQAT